jgi:phospholipid transport system substrate-binding protein
VKGNDAEVLTTLLAGKEKVPVVYRLYRNDAKAAWRIYDVVTDDVSLLATYRDQFRKLIADKGYEGLLNALKSKRDQLEKNAAAPSN